MTSPLPRCARIEKAVELYCQGLALRLLFSGGVGLHPPARARVMKELAVRLGVPAETCLLVAHGAACARWHEHLLKEQSS